MVYDHETEAKLFALPDPEEKADHEDCEESPAFPGTNPGALASYILWQDRHNERKHGAPGLTDSDYEMIEILTGTFDLDLTDDTVRSTIMRVTAGLVLYAMRLEEQYPDMRGDRVGLMQAVNRILTSVVAQVEMGEVRIEPVGSDA